MFLELALATALRIPHNTQYLMLEAEGVAIRLLNAQCFTAQMENVLKAQKRRTEPRGAVIKFKGKEIRACWALADEDYILIIDETGVSDAIPVNAFKAIPYI